MAPKRVGILPPEERMAILQGAKRLGLDPYESNTYCGEQIDLLQKSTKNDKKPNKNPQILVDKFLSFAIIYA